MQIPNFKGFDDRYKQSMVLQSDFDDNIFTTEMVNQLLEQGFEYQKGCHSYASETSKVESSDSAFKKYLSAITSTSVYVYIRNNRVEVDNDYECGGNLSHRIFPFDSIETLQEALQEAHDHVRGNLL